jgi:hypothetical protein
MAAGWGIVPFGAGDWGSEGTVLPGAGSVALAGQAPELLSGTVIQPDAGSLTASGAAPTAITGVVVGPGAGAVAFTGAVPTLLEGKVFIPGAGTLTLAGQQVGVAFTVTPPANSLSITGQIPRISTSVEKNTGSGIFVVIRSDSGSSNNGYTEYRVGFSNRADPRPSNNSNTRCRVGCNYRPNPGSFTGNSSYPSGRKFDANGGCTSFIKRASTNTPIRSLECRRVCSCNEPCCATFWIAFYCRADTDCAF